MKKIKIQRAMHRGVFVGGVCSVLFFASMTVGQAAVALTWSGGNGSPLSLTLSSPVAFTATGSSPFIAFIMPGAGDSFTSFTAVTGLTYSVNGGSDQAIDSIHSGYSVGNVVPNDTYIFNGTGAGVIIGDVVTLSAGTLTTTDSFAGAPPSNTSVEMFITDELGVNIGGGTAVPETSTALLGGLSLLGLLRRRRA